MNNYYAYFFNINLESVKNQREEAHKAGFANVVDFAFQLDDKIFEITESQFLNFLKENDTANK